MSHVPSKLTPEELAQYMGVDKTPTTSKGPVVVDQSADLHKDVPLTHVTVTTPFAIKDSGKREQFESGMVRDTADDKIDYTLVLDGPMFERWAVHLTKGAKKYAKRNWMKASGEAELARFKESALRHFISYLRGDTDEDHAAGTIFNINGAEYVKEKMKNG